MKLVKIQLLNGIDKAEDWISRFKIALEELMWKNGTKLIFQFADGPHHGQFCKVDRVDIEDDIHNKNLIQIKNSWSKRKIKIVGIYLLIKFPLLMYSRLWKSEWSS